MNKNTPNYVTFPDYILGITYEIWEERGINKIRDYYHRDTIVRSADGVIEGNDTVIRATRETLAEFPDRVLLGEDVIWTQIDKNSWYSSHRILSKATHLGSGKYGTPTNKEVVYRTIADCHAVKHPEFGWVINDEWLVRDQGAIYKQLGLFYERDQFIRHPLIDDEDLLGAELDGPYMGTGNNAKPGLMYEEILQKVMSGEVSIVAKMYDRSCQLELGEGKTVHGIDEAEKFWISLRASFPDSDFCIDHRIGQIEDGKPPRSAVRWRLRGEHSGYGLFGPPSGQIVDIMGICHTEFGHSGITRDFILLDYVSIWKQIGLGELDTDINYDLGDDNDDLDYGLDIDEEDDEE